MSQRRGQLGFCLLLLAFGVSLLATQSARSEGELGEVIITALRREENAQRAPLSVNSRNGAELQAAQLATIVDVGLFTSGTNFSHSAVGMGSPLTSTLFIRGVGQLDYTPTMEPGVGLYVDNVYIARAQGAVVDLADVRQVDIVKGPQGTLFGRNAIGGTVNIATRVPTFDGDGASGYGRLGAGSFRRLSADGGLNLPFGERAALALSVGQRNSDGFVSRPNAGEHGGADRTSLARVKLALRPGDATELLWSTDYRNTDAAAPAQYVAAFDANAAPALRLYNQLVGAARNSVLSAANSLSPDDHTDLGSGLNRTEFEGWGSSIQLDRRLESLQLRSVTAYRSFRSRNRQDLDGSPVAFNHDDYADSQHQLSEEITLLGTAWGERLKWTAGAFYLEESARSTYHIALAQGLYQVLQSLPAPLVPLGAFTCPGGPACAGGATNPLNTQFDLDLYDAIQVHSRSTAVYADGTWLLTPRLSLLAGLRYTADRKSYTVSVLRAVSGSYLVPPTVAPAGSWNSLSPRVGLQWQLSGTAMAYATVAQGYKAGGYNPRPGTQAAALKLFDPEDVWAYELGAKTESLGGRLRLNAALFHYRYRDMQLAATEVLPGSVVATEVIDNAGHARMNGAELDVAMAASRGLTLLASGAWLDARYLDSSFSITGISVDTPLPKAPRWTAATAAQYSLPVASGNASVRIDYAYTSENYPDFRATAALKQRAHGLVNTSASWSTADAHLAYTLAASNLFDVHYVQNGVDLLTTQGSVIAKPAPPRVVTLQVSGSF